MKLKKLRVINPKRKDSRYLSGYQEDKYGITIPDDIAMFFSGTYFKIEKAGNQIILTSGCLHKFTDKEIENYKFEDCIING
jgi:hypothetical protein